MIGLLKKLLGWDAGDRTAHVLYTEAVSAARRPDFYLAGGVADSLDGRFDVIILHLWLIIARLHALRDDEKGWADGAAKLEQRLLAVHFSDMDQALREIGVGDLSVGKKVKAMAQAFYGRALAYDAAMAALDATADRAPLHDALLRNLYRGQEVSDDALALVADYVIAARRVLAAASVDDLLAGRFPVPTVEGAAQ